MTTNQELRKLALDATPQDIDTAELIEKHKSGERFIVCPYCQGSGDHELEADYCNYDSVAIGVQFYGIGKHHGAAEAFFRAANPAKVIELLDRIDRLEAQNEAQRKLLEQAHDALLAEYGKEGGEVVALRQENELLRTALRFYAHGDNYHLDLSEGFDTVSGEPQSWLCSGVEDSETMVENGEVARHTLRGHVIGWEDAEEDHTPQPIAGEAPFSAAALQTAYNTRPQQAAQVAQPLTQDDVFADDRIMEANADAGLDMARIMQFVRAVEAAHGIGKDQP